MTVTATAAAITDSRLDVIGYARDVLGRAQEEARSSKTARVNFRLIAAIAALEGALRGWGNAGGEDEKDEAVRLCGLRTVQLVSIVDAELGWDAAEYVSKADDEGDEQ